MPTQAMNRYQPKTARLDPCYNPEDAEEQVVKLMDGTYLRGTVLGEKVGASEEVHIIIANATGGYFTATMPTTPVGAGSTSAHIAYNAPRGDIEDALEAMPAIGEGNVIVTDLGSGTFDVLFSGALADQEIDDFAVTDATSGSGHSVTVSQITDGDPGTHGTFGAFDEEATDGRQHAKCILRYACTVSAGVVTGISEWGAQQVNAVSAFMRGYFRTEELVGLNDKSLADLHATVVQGDTASGVVRIG